MKRTVPRSIPIAPSYTGRSAIVELSGKIGGEGEVWKEGLSRVEIFFINSMPHMERGRKFCGSGKSRAVGGQVERRKWKSGSQIRYLAIIVKEIKKSRSKRTPPLDTSPKQIEKDCHPFVVDFGARRPRFRHAPGWP